MLGKERSNSMVRGKEKSNVEKSPDFYLALLCSYPLMYDSTMSPACSSIKGESCHGYFVSLATTRLGDVANKS